MIDNLELKVERRSIMKKSLRYLLSMIAVVSVLSVSAQTFAQQPEAQMQSTSVMQGSGSNLPNAAVQGVSTTYDNSLPDKRNVSGPRRERPGDWVDPYPIGDAVLPLMLLALSYMVVRTARKRKGAVSK